MDDHGEQSDGVLVRRIREGDDTAFQELTDRYSARLHARIERRLTPYVRRKVAASDVLQDAYVAALRRIDDFEDRGEGSFGRWLSEIVESRIKDAIRRHVGARKRSVGREVSRGGRLPTEGFAARGPSPSQMLAGKELKEAVRRAFERLPEDSREVVTLIQHERLDLDRAAERMDRSREAVKKLYGRALARLEELLELETRLRHGRRRPTR